MYPIRAVGLMLLLLWISLPVRPAGAIAPDRWEPVTQEERAQTGSRVEPNADAEVIFHHEWVEDHFADQSIKQARDVYVRLKVFTEEGAEAYSRVQIDYSMRGERVSEIEARTILPDGTILLLGKNAVMTETVLKKRKAGIQRKSFALPGVKPGCIVEYRYHKVQMDAWLASSIYTFQQRIPVQMIVYHVKPLSAEGWYVRIQKFNTTAVTSTRPVDGYYDIAALDQPAYHQEPDGPPELQQRGWMILYYTREKLKEPADFWTRLGKELAGAFDGESRPGGGAQRLAEEIIAGANDEEAKVGALIAWIRSEFRVVRSANPDSLRAANLRAANSGRKALEQRGGTHYDANLAFATLARAAGLEVRLLRTPSRDEYFFDQQMMNREFVRYVQIGVRVNGAWRCYDPGQQFLPADMLLWSQESVLGLFCDRDSTVFLETPISGPDRSVLARSASLVLHQDGLLEGDVTVTVSGHLNHEWRTLFEGERGDQVDSTLIKEAWDFGELELSKFEWVRGGDPRAPLQVRCHLVLREYAAVTAKRIIIEPAALDSRQAVRFPAGTRRQPVYFPYAWSERDTVRIRLPEGWKAENVDSPEPLKAIGLGEYSTQVLLSSDGREVLCLRELQVGTGGSIFFPPEAYPAVKKFFDHVHDRDRATVTLVRAEGGP